MVDAHAGKFEVVAVNVEEDEEDLVLPEFKEHHYTFSPYRLNADIARAYRVRGAPMEFLIDTKGGAVLQVRISSDERERSLSEIVDQLLKEGK